MNVDPYAILRADKQNKQGAVDFFSFQLPPPQNAVSARRFSSPSLFAPPAAPAAAPAAAGQAAVSPPPLPYLSLSAPTSKTSQLTRYHILLIPSQQRLLLFASPFAQQPESSLGLKQFAFFVLENANEQFSSIPSKYALVLFNPALIMANSGRPLAAPKPQATALASELHIASSPVDELLLFCFSDESLRADYLSGLQSCVDLLAASLLEKSRLITRMKEFEASQKEKWKVALSTGNVAAILMGNRAGAPNAPGSGMKFIPNFHPDPALDAAAGASTSCSADSSTPASPFLQRSSLSGGRRPSVDDSTIPKATPRPSVLLPTSAAGVSSNFIALTRRARSASDPKFDLNDDERKILEACARQITKNTPALTITILKNNKAVKQHDTLGSAINFSSPVSPYTAESAGPSPLSGISPKSPPRSYSLSGLPPVGGSFSSSTSLSRLSPSPAYPNTNPAMNALGAANNEKSPPLQRGSAPPTALALSLGSLENTPILTASPHQPQHQRHTSAFALSPKGESVTKNRHGSLGSVTEDLNAAAAASALAASPTGFRRVPVLNRQGSTQGGLVEKTGPQAKLGRQSESAPAAPISPFSLQTAIDVVYYAHAFHTYLRKNLCVENLLFLQATSLYERLSEADIDTRKQAAIQIYLSYCYPSTSNYLINLDDITRNQIEATILKNEFSSELFRRATKVIYSMASSDVYHRFQSTTEYQNILASNLNELIHAYYAEKNAYDLYYFPVIRNEECYPLLDELMDSLLGSDLLIKQEMAVKSGGLFKSKSPKVGKDGKEERPRLVIGMRSLFEWLAASGYAATRAEAIMIAQRLRDLALIRPAGKEFVPKEKEKDKDKDAPVSPYVLDDDSYYYVYPADVSSQLRFKGVTKDQLLRERDCMFGILYLKRLRYHRVEAILSKDSKGLYLFRPVTASLLRPQASPVSAGAAPSPRGTAPVQAFSASPNSPLSPSGSGGQSPVNLPASPPINAGRSASFSLSSQLVGHTLIRLDKASVTIHLLQPQPHSCTDAAYQAIESIRTSSEPPKGDDRKLEVNPDEADSASSPLVSGRNSLSSPVAASPHRGSFSFTGPRSPTAGGLLAGTEQRRFSLTYPSQPRVAVASRPLSCPNPSKIVSGEYAYIEITVVRCDEFTGEAPVAKQGGVLFDTYLLLIEDAIQRNRWKQAFVNSNIPVTMKNHHV